MITALMFVMKLSFGPHFDANKKNLVRLMMFWQDFLNPNSLKAYSNLADITVSRLKI